MISWNNAYKVLLEIGSFSGLVSIILAFRDRSRKKPKFKYAFRGSSRSEVTKDNLKYARLTFEGDIKNQSAEPNSITNIYFVVWDGKSRTRTLAFGGEPAIQGLSPKQTLHLPMSFNPKESKRVSVVHEVIMSGNHMEKLFSEVTRVSSESHVFLPKHEFRLIFQDTSENIFEENGRLLNRKLIDLWWTLPNSFESLKKGNPFPWLKHMSKIFFNSIIFNFAKLMYKLGV